MRVAPAILRQSRRERFEAALQALLERGEYPAAHVILAEIHPGRSYRTDAALGGLECRWRREYLLARGWTAPPGGRGRWRPPPSDVSSSPAVTEGP